MSKIKRHFTAVNHKLASGVFAALLTIGSTTSALAAELPGKGTLVQPIKSSLVEETFQTMLVMRALEKLGYDVAPIKIAEYSIAFGALANGDATFIAAAWFPLHENYYKKLGGDKNLFVKGAYSPNAITGYMIDKKTADAYKITSLAQLKDPAIAKLFDADGNGKADLVGCPSGWDCQNVIEHHIDAYKLRDTVVQNKGSYPAMIANTISQFRAGKPVLYWTWTPYWLSNTLKPGVDVIWLEVPFTSLPGEQKGINTQLPSGKNYGFPVSTQRIVANRSFIDKNPAAAKLFAIMQLSVGDINSQNLRMHEGENTNKDVQRHVDSWIKANQTTFDSWIKQSLDAAN